MPVLEALVSLETPQGALGGGWQADAASSPKRSALAELLDPFPLPTVWALTALTDDPTGP